MSTIPTIEHRRGTTFSYAGRVALPAGTWAASSSLEAPDGSIATNLVATLTPLAVTGGDGATHTLLLTSPALATESWPHRSLSGDVLFTDQSGLVLATSRYSVVVTRGVTRAA